MPFANWPRWRKKLLALLLLFFAFIGGCYIVGTDAEAPEDRDLTPRRNAIPTSENGFVMLQEASALVVWPEADSGDDERWRKMAQGREWDELRVERLLLENEQALTLLEHAVAHPRIQIPEPLALDERGFSILPWRRLADVLALRARQHFLANRHDRALADALRLVRFGYQLEGAEGGLIDFFLGASFKRQGFALVREWLPQMKSSGSSVCGLMERLEPYAPSAEHVRKALRQDYVEFADVVDDPSEEIPTNLLDFPILGRYIYQRNETKAMLADAYRVIISNVDVPYSQHRRPAVVERRDGDALRFMIQPNFVGKVVYKNALPSEKIWMQQHWGEVDYAAVRALVAIDCYRRRHGSVPATLDALVPDILKSIPRDPFDNDSLRYDSARPAVYSVGPDLVDEGGSEGDHPADMPDPTFELRN